VYCRPGALTGRLFQQTAREPTSLTHSPFAVLTFIVAHALLTNSSRVLALSTINRMLRTRERMPELFARNLDCGSKTDPALPMLIQ